MSKLSPSCTCGKDRDCTSPLCQCGDTDCECPRAAAFQEENRRLAQESRKPPQQTFDQQHQVRFRIRGTQEQIVKVHELMVQLAREAALESGTGRARFTAALGTSGPVSGDEQAKQWAMAFWCAPRLVDRIRGFLTEIGLTEEA